MGCCLVVSQLLLSSCGGCLMQHLLHAIAFNGYCLAVTLQLLTVVVADHEHTLGAVMAMSCAQRLQHKHMHASDFYFARLRD